MLSCLKMHILVHFDTTSSYIDWLKSSQITWLHFLAADLCTSEISTNINVQLEVTSNQGAENQLLGVEHSSANQKELERDQQGTDYHPGPPLMKASAPWRLTNSMRAAQWVKLKIDMSRCAKCANQLSEETTLSCRNHRSVARCLHYRRNAAP